MKILLLSLLCFLSALILSRVNATTYRKLSTLEKLRKDYKTILPLSVNMTVSSRPDHTGRVNAKVFGTATGLLFKNIFLQKMPTAVVINVNSSLLINPHKDIPDWLATEYGIVKEISHKFFTLGQEYYSRFNLNWLANAAATYPEIQIAINKARVTLTKPTYANVVATLEAARTTLETLNPRSKLLDLQTALGLNSTYKFKFAERLREFLFDFKVFDFSVNTYLRDNIMPDLDLGKVREMFFSLTMAYIQRYSFITPAGDGTKITKALDDFHTFIVNFDYTQLLYQRDFVVNLGYKMHEEFLSLMKVFADDCDVVTDYIHYTLMSVCTATRDHLKTLSKTLILPPLNQLRDIMLVLQQSEIQSGNLLNIEKFDPIFLKESIKLLNSNEAINPFDAVEVVGSALLEASKRLYEAWTLHMQRLDQRLAKDSTSGSLSNAKLADTLAMFLAKAQEVNVNISESLPEVETAPCNNGGLLALLPTEPAIPVFVFIGQPFETIHLLNGDGKLSGNVKAALMKLLPKIKILIKERGYSNLSGDVEQLSRQINEMPTEEYLYKIYSNDDLKLFQLPEESMESEPSGQVRPLADLQRQDHPMNLPGSAQTSVSKEDLEASLIMVTNEERRAAEKSRALKNTLAARRRYSKQDITETCTRASCKLSAGKQLQELPHETTLETF